MVNRGRSGGCVTCKKRRVKCDEEKPECRRCRNRDVVCEGYVKKPIDLKFKDQSRKFGTASCSPQHLPSPVRRLSEPVQGVVSLHNRTSTPNVQDQRNRHSGKAIERQSGAARTNTKLNRAQDELITSVPRPLAQIDVAVPFFLTHYASLGRDVQSARGYFEMLIPVYTSQQQDSALVLAISAVASEILSLWRHRSNSFKSPRVPYARAVARLQKSAITAVDLVEACLDQIARHNHAGLHLNAVISVAPRDKLIAAAARLDAERQAGRSRGPLHAIPIVLKDCILTSTETLGLPTTSGCPCFAAATCVQNSPLVDRLLDAGLLIIGKANLTELCGLKMRPNTPGWSAHGGQTQNPYIFGGLEKNEKFIGNSSAGGSSSGSGASVAAGFAPLALGTQTGGSVILPANRAGLYALVCGHGTVPTQGNYCLSKEIDCVGAMAKSALDVNQLASVIMGKEIPLELEENCSFRGMRVGFLDPKVWHLPGNDYCNFPGDTRLQIETAFIEASILIDSLGADIRNDLELSLPGKNFEIQGKSLGYEHCMQRLQSGDFTAFAAQYQDSEVRTLEQMVAWNADHSEISMPPDHSCQDELVDLLNNTSTPEEGQEWRCELMKQGKAGLDPLLCEVDVLVALADSSLCSYSSAAGKLSVSW
ncbi:amidase signature enzyme, partial [Aureobasidium melanogenum]